MRRFEPVLKDFIGSWQVSREIVHADGSRARFDGHAVWTVAGDGALYEETGEMQLPGQPPMRATRCYLWGADLSVRFEDGRFFHDVPTGGEQAEHWCEPDMYSVTYDFSEWPVFRTTWQVRGPRKDYRMTSLYCRV